MIPNSSEMEYEASQLKKIKGIPEAMDDLYDDDYDDAYEDGVQMGYTQGAAVRGVDQAEVAPDSFLGMANQTYVAPNEELSDQDKYLARLEEVGQMHKSSAWQGDDRAQQLRDKIPLPDTTDRILGTMSNMALAFLVSGGNPAAMALMGYATFTRDEDREYRYNQMDELVQQGYSDRTIRQFIDSGDDRYLAEDSRARVAQEQEQWNRQVNVRNFAENQRQYDTSFGLEKDKFGETQRKNLEDERVARGNLAVSQQQTNWNTDPNRYQATITTADGRRIPVNQYGKPIDIYGGASDIDPKTGKPYGTGTSKDDSVWNLVDNKTGDVIEKVVGSAGNWRRFSDNTTIKLGGKSTETQVLPTGEQLQLYGDELYEGRPRYQMMDEVRTGAWRNQQEKFREKRKEVMAENAKTADQFDEIANHIDNITQADVDAMTGFVGRNRPEALTWGTTLKGVQKFDSLAGKTFAPALEVMSGKGAVSNIEGSAVNSALNTMIDRRNNNAVRGMDDGAYWDSLKILQVAAKRKAIIERRKSQGDPITMSELNKIQPPYFGEGANEQNRQQWQHTVEQPVPDIGTIRGDKMYKGGNPTDPNNWELVGAQPLE